MWLFPTKTQKKKIIHLNSQLGEEEKKQDAAISRQDLHSSTNLAVWLHAIDH